MGIGLLFPGQASQFPGMGKDLHDAYPVARRTFEEASDAMSLDVAALCFRGTEEELRMTENTQPAIFTVSVAAFRVLAAETGIRPVCAAGHSLGEYSALVAAGALPLGEAVRVLQSRGKYMQEAVPVGEGAMAAILGLSPEQVGEARGHVLGALLVDGLQVLEDLAEVRALPAVIVQRRLALEHVPIQLGRNGRRAFRHGRRAAGTRLAACSRTSIPPTTKWRV